MHDNDKTSTLYLYFVLLLLILTSYIVNQLQLQPILTVAMLRHTIIFYNKPFSYRDEIFNEMIVTCDRCNSVVFLNQR